MEYHYQDQVVAEDLLAMQVVKVQMVVGLQVVAEVVVETHHLRHLELVAMVQVV
jgi:cell division protein FtsL